MEEHSGVTDETLEIVEKSKNVFKQIDTEFETIIGCNQKTAYINGMHETIDAFKDYIIKKYAAVKESFGPFSWIDELAEEAKNLSE